MKRKVRVMIVDDESHIRRYMHSIVDSISDAISGVEVVAEAEDGESALEVYEQVKPDIILLDINMPKKNGMETLEEIRKTDQETSIIILTSLSSIEMVKKSLALHAANYVLKDNPPEKIREVIKQVCFNHIQAQAQA